MGEYRIRPVFVDDMAGMVVSAGQRGDNVVMDAVGPETFTHKETVRLIGDKVGKKARVVHVAPGLALFSSRLMGYLVRDVVLTRDEIDGCMADLLVTEGPPTGQTRLSD